MGKNRISNSACISNTIIGSSNYAFGSTTYYYIPIYNYYIIPSTQSTDVHDRTNQSTSDELLQFYRQKPRTDYAPVESETGRRIFWARKQCFRWFV